MITSLATTGSFLQIAVVVLQPQNLVEKSQAQENGGEAAGHKMNRISGSNLISHPTSGSPNVKVWDTLPTGKVQVNLSYLAYAPDVFLVQWVWFQFDIAAAPVVYSQALA